MLTEPLRDARARQFLGIDEGIDITLAVTQFLNNTDSVQNGNEAKELGEFLGDQLTLWYIFFPDISRRFS